MTIAALILLGLTLLAAAFAVWALRTERDDDTTFGTFIVAGCLAVVLLIMTCIAGWLAIAPAYRLHKASIEKRILVEQAKAEADAAKEEAKAEVERAKGTAEANKIVDASITEPYLRYLYINSLKNTKNQVIYLPTEAGLPILEADRLAQK